MFRQHIACHPQGALVVLAKITIKHSYARGVRGVAAYRGSVCAHTDLRYAAEISIWLHTIKHVILIYLI